jgi:heparin/heparan-sulfate lyase
MAIASLLAALAFSQAGGAWTTFDGVSIPVPPPEHPRLYLRARDLPDLQRRTTHPVLKPLWERLQALGAEQPARAVEAAALRYLLTRDEALARETIARTLRLLHETKFDPRQQDVTRPIGRLLVTGAVVYDWCYPAVTPEQKRDFQERFLHLAHSLEHGYPPPKAGGVTGHYSEWILMRDLLSAGVAIYDEFPEMYRLAAHRFFSVHQPVRNWWYRGHAFHQGTAYSETRASSELYPLWIFWRMGAGAVYDQALQFLPYSWIYLRRPDGQLLRGGDGQSRPPKLRSLLNASFYKDPYVLADYLRDPDIDPGSLLFAFLWRDPGLQPKPVAELPLSRYMGSPYGWMIARSGWDEESVIAELKVNLYNFNNHQHLDAGAFQVYYKGPLAIDSGVYEGATGGYGSEHDVNYNKRTIAHNSLLIYDPAETFARSTRVMHNDGGQRFPNGWREPRNLEDMLANYRTAEVLGQAFGPDPQQPAYTYLKGDLTRAYSAKVRRAERSFVFLNLAPNPVRAALLIFDQVESANPEHKKYWLLHAMEEPRIAGDTMTIAPEERGWRGKLVNRVLLPAGADITPVGGPGREFEVFGRNFPNHPHRGRPEDHEIGAWRVEVSPPEPLAADQFLNVMQIMDRDTAPGPVSSLAAGPLACAALADTTVCFNRTAEPLRRGIELRTTTSRLLATGLAPGRWQLTRAGTRPAAPVTVTPEGGVLWHSGPAGAYALHPVEVPQP